MDKESGVYFTITDNSIQTGGVSQINLGIPMLTVKGKLGLNRVTANDFKDILGYDIDYNSNYLGLAKILEQVSYADVWRINQNAKLANAYFISTDTDKASDDDAETFEDITKKEDEPILAAALKDVGEPGTMAVKFTPLPQSTSYPNESPVPAQPQVIVFDDVSQTEETTYQEVTIKAGCIIYDSTNTQIIGVIKPNYADELRIYRVIDGELLDDVIQVTNTNIWNDGTNFLNSEMQITSEPQGEPSEPVEIGTVRESIYTLTNQVWTLGNTFIDTNHNVTTEPSGTAGTPVTLGEGYIVPAGDAQLIPGTMYFTDDVGTTYFQVVTLGEDVAHFNYTEVTDTNEIAILQQKYSDTVFENLSYVAYTQTLDTGMYKKNSDSWFKVVSLSTTMIVTNVDAETNAAIISALEAASDITITYYNYENSTLVQDNSCGTAVWNDTELTLTLVKALSRESFWYARTIPTIIKNWTMTVASYEDDQYRILNNYSISTDPESDIYWQNVEFEEIDLFIKASIPSNWQTVRLYFTLDNGSNGDLNIVAADIDTTILDTCGWNMIAMNGITSYKVVNKLAPKAEKYFIHIFADAPAYASYVDLENWKKNIYSSEYIHLGCRPDKVEIDDQGRYAYMYPSVNYIAIYSRMLEEHGNFNYPPAGFTYGTISVEELMECDYELYGNEMKTNRLNWQRQKSQGTVMWEQRTTYALNSDLSYIAPVFILDSLRQQLFDYEELFTFRYMSPIDLMNQESGIRNILDSFVTQGFLFNYDLHVPSYEEAQKAGRTLNIDIGIYITKDSEVININITLKNA